MKRMFYAAHTPGPLPRSLAPAALFLSLPHLPSRIRSPFCAVAVSLVGQNTYRTYRLLPAAFPVILSGHRRPGRELLLTCMHVVPPLRSPSLPRLLPPARPPQSMFSSVITKPRPRHRTSRAHSSGQTWIALMSNVFRK